MMLEVVVTAGTDVQSSQSNHHHQQTNVQLFTGRMPFLSPKQHCQITEERKYHNSRTCSPGSSILILTGSRLPWVWVGLSRLSSARWCQCPINTSWNLPVFTADLLCGCPVYNKLCAWRHNMPPPLSFPLGARAPRAPPSRRNVAVFPKPNTFSRWPLQPPYALRPCWVKRAGDLWPFDLESGVRVTFDMIYLCAKFELPRLLCSRLRPDVCDRRQTDRKTSDKSIA